MDPNKQQLEEIYRLTKENNHMLHAMRRGALWAGIFKFMLYAAFFLVPIWFYMTYLNASVQQMLKTVDEINGTGAKASAQFGGLAQSLKDLEAKIPGFGQGQSVKQ